MSEMEEISKAIQQSAKLGEKGIEIADKAGSFFAKIFSEPFSEIAGIVHDKLRFIRWKRMAAMSDEVNEILIKRGILNTRSVPPKIALPLLEEATIEDNPTLQSIWNNLLANAMDPNFNDEIRYGFIEMIKNITGIEASILKIFYDLLSKDNRILPIEGVYNYCIKKELFISILNISVSQYAISANNLMRMQLLAPAIKTGGASFGNDKLTSYKGIEEVTLTPLSIKFIEACLK
jgi:hypothetical protein